MDARCGADTGSAFHFRIAVAVRQRVLRICDGRRIVLTAFDSGAAYDSGCHAQRNGSESAGIRASARLRDDHRGCSGDDAEPRCGKEGRTMAVNHTEAMPPQLRAARVRKQRVIKAIILTFTLLFLFVPLDDYCMEHKIPHINYFYHEELVEEKKQKNAS